MRTKESHHAIGFYDFLTKYFKNYKNNFFDLTFI